MPQITENTPVTEITVAGETFKAPQPYEAGHVLTANEASALNQTYAENLRNNFAAKVKEAKEAGTFDADMFQSRFSEYADEYEFGVRTGGGRTGDPVMAEAMSIARELVRKAVQKKGHKLADIPASQISTLAKNVISKGDANSEKILEAARARVAASQELDTDVEISDEAATEAAAAEPRARKGKADQAAAA